MRIAHVTDCYLPRLGGIELQVRDLAQRQVEAGHVVTVITSTHGDRCETAGVAVRRIGAGSHSTGSIGYGASVRGSRAALHGSYDVVHVHASSFSPLAFLVAHHSAQRGIPTAATVHSLWSRATRLFSVADVLSGWADWPVAWSAVSGTAAAPLQRVLAGRAGVTVLANGIDPDAWSVVPEGARPGQLRVAVVARLAPRKRPLHLARILRAARDRITPGTEITVEIVGDGPERRALERYLARHDMASWVRLTGSQTRDRIRELFSRSDLFVSASMLESFGIAALEARCSGLPILARSGTGMNDFVVDGCDGWLVGSDSAMIDTIVALATNPQRLAHVGDHNREVRPAVSWTKTLLTCDGLYEEAIRRCTPDRSLERREPQAAGARQRPSRRGRAPWPPGMAAKASAVASPSPRRRSRSHSS